MQVTTHDGCVTFSLIRDEKDKMNYVPQFKLIFFCNKAYTVAYGAASGYDYIKKPHIF